MRLYLSTPTVGWQVSAGWYYTQAALTEFCRREGWTIQIVPQWGVSDLIRARNVAVHQFLKSGMDILVTFDSDQHAEPDVFRALAESPHPIAAAPVPKRTELAKGAQKWNFMCETGEQVREGDFLRVAAVGAGCMAIKREVLFTMAERNRCFMAGSEPVPELYARDFTNVSRLFPEQISEDYSFCLRARACGFAPWLYVPGKVIHYGEKGFTEVLTW